jgi:hypothetical protein
VVDLIEGEDRGDLVFGLGFSAAAAAQPMTRPCSSKTRHDFRPSASKQLSRDEGLEARPKFSRVRDCSLERESA